MCLKLGLKTGNMRVLIYCNAILTCSIVIFVMFENDLCQN